MTDKKPFIEPEFGEAQLLTNRDANFPLMPLMGGGSAGVQLDFPILGSGADGAFDGPGSAPDGVTPANGLGGDTVV